MQAPWSTVAATLLKRARAVLIKAGIRGFDADDLAVEALAATWQAFRDASPAESEMLAMITTIASRRAADHFDRGSREVPGAPSEADLPDESPDALVDHLTDALKQLSDQERQIVLLHFVHDLTYQDIAALTDTPLSTVRARSIRAIRMLRHLLKS